MSEVLGGDDSGGEEEESCEGSGDVRICCRGGERNIKVVGTEEGDCGVDN